MLVEIASLSKLHCLYTIVSAFVGTIETVKTQKPELYPILKRLSDLFGKQLKPCYSIECVRERVREICQVWFFFFNMYVLLTPFFNSNRSVVLFRTRDGTCPH